MAMFYRLDGSNYLFVDWSRLDGCLKPSDRDKAGRLCGKRATSGKQAGKIKAGSEEAKALAKSIREQSYGTGRKGKSPQRKAAIAEKAATTKARNQFEKQHQERAKQIKSRSPNSPEAKEAALKAKAIARQQQQIKQIADDPTAQKAIRRKIDRTRGGDPRKQYILSEAKEYKETGSTGLEKLQEEHASKSKSSRKFGVVEGGGQSDPNFIKDPAKALKEAKRRRASGNITPVETELIPRDMAMRGMTAKAETDKALNEMKETVAKIEKKQKARKARTRSKAKKAGMSVVEGGNKSPRKPRRK